MRDPARIPDVTAALAHLWERHPDMRLGQLLMAVCNGDPFFVEDDTWVSKFKTYEETHEPDPVTPITKDAREFWKLFDSKSLVAKILKERQDELND